jgi:hypothetical protein
VEAIPANAAATRSDSDAALPRIFDAPSDEGTLEMIVRRPAEGAREVLDEAELDLAVGLVGDNWSQRPSSRMPDNSPHPDMQLNVMNARVLQAVAGDDRSRWALAGDQLLVDLDLRPENLPPGTRLSIGSAVIEVTDQPHTGCAKFRQRFGPAASAFVNSAEGKQMRMRGLNAKVIEGGTIRPGDIIEAL